jgi:hypothetical protein
MKIREGYLLPANDSLEEKTVGWVYFRVYVDYDSFF